MTSPVSLTDVGRNKLVIEATVACGMKNTEAKTVIKARKKDYNDAVKRHLCNESRFIAKRSRA